MVGIRRIKEIVEEVKAELEEQNMDYRIPEQGIMIETPAAVMVSADLAEEVDFFSIGTNDLTSIPWLWTVRIHNWMRSMIPPSCSPGHDSDDCGKCPQAGIWAGICGELGADLTLTREFLAMGVDELSVSPGRILPIRKIVLETDVEEYKRKKMLTEKQF